MPYTAAQWKAIAARTIAKYGREEGERKLREYKREADRAAGARRLSEMSRRKRH